MQRKTIYLAACGVTIGAILCKRTHCAGRDQCIVKNNQVYRGPDFAIEFPGQTVRVLKDKTFCIELEPVSDNPPTVHTYTCTASGEFPSASPFVFDIVVGPNCRNNTSLAKIADYIREDDILIEKSMITHARWQLNNHHPGTNTEEFERKINDVLVQFGLIVKSITDKTCYEY
jgi:hypothetical protein